MKVSNQKCVNTEKFYNNMISFPFHAWMKNEDFEYLIKSLEKTIKKLNA